MARERFSLLHHQKINQTFMVYDLLKFPLLFIVVFPGLAAGNDFDPIDYLETIETIQGEFIQRSLDGSSQMLQESTGEIFIKKPNQLLWKMKHPNQKTVLIDENTITYFDADLEQILISDYLEENQVSWVNLFLNNSAINSTYRFKEKKLSNGETHISFDDVEGDYKSITFTFNSGMVQGINLLDNSANSISIEFTRFEINQILSDNLFNFQYPSSADVIDQRR